MIKSNDIYGRACAPKPVEKVERSLRSPFLVVLSFVLCSVILTSCGDSAKSIKKSKFDYTVQSECGTPPEVISAIKGAGLSFDTVNLRLAGDEGFRDKVKNPVTDVFTGYVPTALGKPVELASQKYKYYGTYVLSDDETSAQSMREAYIAALVGGGWEYEGTMDIQIYGDIYFKDGHLVGVSDVLSPVNWDTDPNSGVTLYGMYVNFF